MEYSRSLLFHFILEYSRIFQNVTQYSIVFKNIQKYSQIFENIWEYSRIFWNILEYSGIIGKLFPRRYCIILWDLRKSFDLSKFGLRVKIEKNKEKGLCIDLWLGQLVDLCDFDLGKVDYTVRPRKRKSINQVNLSENYNNLSKKVSIFTKFYLSSFFWHQIQDVEYEAFQMVMSKLLCAE